MLVHGYIAVLINVCNYQLRNFGGQLAHGLALAVNVVSARARCTVIIHAERKALIAAQLLALIETTLSPTLRRISNAASMPEK